MTLLVNNNDQVNRDAVIRNNNNENIENDLEAALIQHVDPLLAQLEHRKKIKSVVGVFFAAAICITLPILLVRFLPSAKPILDFQGLCADGYSTHNEDIMCADNYFDFEHYDKSFQLMREYLANNATIIPGETLKATCCPENNSSRLNHVCCESSPYQDYRFYRIQQIIYNHHQYYDEYDIRWMIAKDEFQARNFFRNYLLSNATSYSGRGDTCVSSDGSDDYCAMSAKDKFTSIHPQEEPWKSSNSTSIFTNVIEMKRWFHQYKSTNSISNWFTKIKQSITSISIFATKDLADRNDPQNPKLISLNYSARKLK